MRNRTIITNVQPCHQGKSYPIKRTTGEQITVNADIFSDGEDSVKVRILYKESKADAWKTVPMQHKGNDEWHGAFAVEQTGWYEYKIEAWVDELQSWYNHLMKRLKQGVYLAKDLSLGADILRKSSNQTNKEWAAQLSSWSEIVAESSMYHKALDLVTSDEFSKAIAVIEIVQHPTYFDHTPPIQVGRKKEIFSTWYQLFPRSTGTDALQHGTFKDCEKVLPRIADMGFDVLLFPPVYPIGKSHRKGKNNALLAEDEDVGSPWSVGSNEGGHTSLHPALGSMKDFQKLMKKAADKGLEIAIDMGLRCSPDHPYIERHPDWFHHLPDGRLDTEEDPPLSYKDIINFNFDCDDWENLWEELKNNVMFWADKGVRIFFASTPHNKPFAFWQWLIKEVQAAYPDTIFLSGAFTRPKPMLELAKAGFTQSFTYFIWQKNKIDLQSHLMELVSGEWRNYLRPNFFPNTPDILPAQLAGANENAFMLRYALAATLSSNCGIYGPMFELGENRANPYGSEQYLDSEKYEIKSHDWNARNRLTTFITLLNRIRREQPALQQTYNLTFTNTDNEQLLSFVKTSVDGNTTIWCVINLDAENVQSGYIEVPKQVLGITGRYLNLKVKELLSGETYHWFNEWNYVELKPERFPLHILQVV
jgi:starch synthase (maltosyl-transferring)